MRYTYTLTRSLQRIYDLLNLLIDSNEHLSKHEVADKIGCSRPTLNKTIVDANYLIEGFSKIEFTEEGLFLSDSYHVNKRQVRSLICSETFIVQFLVDLFLGKIESIEEWAQLRFYSPSVAYRKIREVNEYLNVMEITLVNDNNFWYLKGDSWKISYMYFQLFKEQAIVGDIWVFEKLDRKVLLKFIKMICDELELFISPIVEYLYTLMIAVQLTMSENPQVLEQIDDEKFQYLLENHVFEESIGFLENYLEREISENERARLVSSTELFPVSYLTKESMYRRVIHSSVTDHQMYQLSFEVYQLFLPDERKVERFTSYLDVFTSLELLNSYQQLNFDKVEEAPYHFDPKHDHSFLEKIAVMEQTIFIGELEHFYLINRSRIVQRLYVLYRTYFKEEKPRALNITFLSQDGAIQEAYYAEKVISFFSEERLTFINSEKVNLKRMWHDVDLIVTDYTLVKFDYHGNIFYVDGLIDENDLKRIEQLIIQIEANF